MATDTLENALLEYRKLLADRDLGLIQQVEFDAKVARLCRIWGNQITRTVSMKAETGKYTRMR